MATRQAIPAHKPVYDVGHLERFPLGLPCPAIVEGVMTLTQRPELAEPDWHLFADATGVGPSVIDLFREALGSDSKRLHPLTIAGGGTVTSRRCGLRVAKRDLVVALKVLLQSERLRFAAGPARYPPAAPPSSSRLPLPGAPATRTRPTSQPGRRM